jgi:EAL domain-containing protein (putative c-di-GMP-specific phosphodiesterase class I)
MRLFAPPRRATDERLLWSRDTRFVRWLAAELVDARVLEIDSGAVLIAPAPTLTEALAADMARDANEPGYGLVTVDHTLPEADRYLMALSAAVQASGLADRIGMAQTTQVVQTKTIDYFFNLRNLHTVAYQPIVELESGALHEYECLFRPVMPMLPQSIASIVQAAIDTDRSIELDAFLVGTILSRAGSIARQRRTAGLPPVRLAINVTPASLLDSRFEASALVAMVRDADLDPRQITLECTEQQAVADVVPLKKAVKALRRAGFGFAVDDAGAGYASFALIAALRPTVIKIDRDIVAGIAKDDAKQALVEAFVSFGRRIGARLLAEGIERRADLAACTSLGVDLGQGFLLGRPAPEPAMPRAMETLRLDAAREAVREAARESARRATPRRVRSSAAD